MIFAYTIDQVLVGQKSQTRRVIKQEEQLHSIGSASRVEIPGKRVIYQVGKSYSVQPGRGKKSVARIILTDIRREMVSAISDSDAFAEGFSSREAFMETWLTIHGSKANLSHEVWVLEFALELIVADELKTLYERRQAENGRNDHRYDIPASITRVSGTHLYCRDHTIG